MAKEKNMYTNPPFREYAGILIAFIVVASFIAIGFTGMVSQVILDKKIEIPPDWMAAMLSLASAALGFLIGANSNKKQNEAVEDRHHKKCLYTQSTETTETD